MSKRKRVRAVAPVAATPPPTSRRRWYLLVGGLALFGGLAVLAWLVLARANARSFVRAADQNVLLITIDTLRADALSCAGGRAATPNLDRLAELGLRFDFAHAHAVLTLPSHASILTGLYPFQHGIHDNAGFRLKPTTPTLASLLHARGMATGAFVGSFALDSRFGLNRDFDVYDEHYGRSNILSGFDIPERRADAVVAAALPWIAAQHGRWFAWVHVYDPHAPYRPPPPFDTRYAGEPYFGEVAFTDSALAPLLDAARDPSGRPTLVVVTGDHGEGLGDHGEQTHGLFAYEATLRIPLILATITRETPAWTGAVLAPSQRGAVSTVSARHVDIAPTILDALMVPPPATLPGRTLLPGGPGRETIDRTSYLEALAASFNRGWAPLTGVLANRDKYIELPLRELYDLGQDPKETVNLVNRELGRLHVLEARLKAFGVVAPAERLAEDPEARARLQALGYVSGSAAPKIRYSDEDDPKRLVGVDQQLRRAIELYEQRRPNEAIPIYRQVIAERPTMEVAYLSLPCCSGSWDGPRRRSTRCARR